MRSLAAVLVVVLSIGACSEEDDAAPPAPGSVEDCKLIANRCHYYDRDGGTELAHDCHEIGHDRKDIAWCASTKAACLAECPERDSGDHGGSGGMSNDAGPDSSGSGGTGGTAGDDAGTDASTDAGGSSGSGGSAGTAGSGGSTGTDGTGGHGGSGGSVGTACEQLGSICHGVPGAFTEHCHDLGHDENEPACEAELVACLAACRG